MTACLVTYGKSDLTEILDSLIFPNVIVWNNWERPKNLRTYGRYMAVREAKTKVVFCQDDDVILTPAQQTVLLEAYEPGKLVANMAVGHQPPAFDAITFLGWGSIFDKDLPDRAHAQAGRFVGPDDEGFQMVGCDIIFSVLTPTRRLDLGRRDLPIALTDGRVSRDPRYPKWKWRYLEIAQEVRCA